jgi:hypothetical protein
MDASAKLSLDPAQLVAEHGQRFEEYQNLLLILLLEIFLKMLYVW